MPRLLILLLSLGCLLRANESPPPPFTFAAIACMPYGDQNWPGFERVITEINRHSPAFTVHCGDIKPGAAPPSESLFLRVRDAFGRFNGPLIYTPGDNEWTDVHRPSNDSQDPALWLAKVRTLFFSEELSWGKTRLPLITQRREPRYAKFVENARWSVGGVVFATIHMVGSENNRQEAIPGAIEEFTERQQANIAWMKASFTEARKTGAPGIAFFFQADAFYQDYAINGRHPAFKAFLDALETESLLFRKPVLLVHGDEHRFRIDQGHRFDRDAAPIPNVIRLATFGETDLHAVFVVVDPSSEDVFLPGPLIVPGNPLPNLPKSPYSR